MLTIYVEQNDKVKTIYVGDQIEFMLKRRLSMPMKLCLELCWAGSKNKQLTPTQNLHCLQVLYSTTAEQ